MYLELQQLCTFFKGKLPCCIDNQFVHSRLHFLPLLTLNTSKVLKTKTETSLNQIWNENICRYHSPLWPGAVKRGLDRITAAGASLLQLVKEAASKQHNNFLCHCMRKWLYILYFHHKSQQIYIKIILNSILTVRNKLHT